MSIGDSNSLDARWDGPAIDGGQQPYRKQRWNIFCQVTNRADCRAGDQCYTSICEYEWNGCATTTGRICNSPCPGRACVGGCACPSRASYCGYLAGRL